MAQLLSTYSLSEILLFTVFLALAIKSVVTFFDWTYDRLKNVFDKDYNRLDDQKQLERRLNKGSKIMSQLTDSQQRTDKLLKDLSMKIDMLIDSDRDDIKSFITREHHYFCYRLKWIDDFSLECCERRYQHYREQGGNSFIEGFMEDLRALPKLDPKNNEQ